MDTFLQMASRGFEQVVGRLSGPLNFRLFIMPTVVSVLAIRAGLRDAREGRPSFLAVMIRQPAERPRLVRAALKDIGKIFVVAVVLDTTYQLVVLRWFYPVQLLFVAVASAIVPYILVRAPTTRIAHALRKAHHRSSVGQPGAAPPPGSGGAA